MLDVRGHRWSKKVGRETYAAEIGVHGVGYWYLSMYYNQSILDIPTPSLSDSNLCLMVFA